MKAEFQDQDTMSHDSHMTLKEQRYQARSTILISGKPPRCLGVKGVHGTPQSSATCKDKQSYRDE